ncbi:MAG: alpha/beta hydrolase fold domain-containing protein, partial [Bacteroidota bacterium]
MKQFFSFSVFFLFAIAISAQCDGTRFLNQVFDNTVITSDITYGENLNWDGSTEELSLDVYEPEGDTMDNRPLIIMAHGGSFVGGEKTGEDVVPLCHDMAKMGFVVASIEYRLGTPLTADLEVPMKQAVVRGYHDMKAAIRWFKKDVAEGDNTYNIDPDKIVLAGVSAGGFITTHVAYMDDLAEIPAEVDLSLPGLTGGLDGDSGNPGYTSDVLGVINIAGALGDTTWMEPGDLPILSLHGTGDNTVPYGQDMLTVLGLVDIDTVAGSSVIHERAENLGLTHCFETHFLQGHVPHVSNEAYYDTTRSFMSNFSTHLVCDIPLECEYRELDLTNSILENSSLEISVYPNPAQTYIDLNTDFQGMSEVMIYDIKGTLVQQGFINGPSGRVMLDLESGSY